MVSTRIENVDGVDVEVTWQAGVVCARTRLSPLSEPPAGPAVDSPTRGLMTSSSVVYASDRDMTRVIRTPRDLYR